MSEVTVTTNYPNVDLTWTAPSTGSEAIDEYEILIYSYTTSAYVEDLTNCDGNDGGAVETGLTCSFAATDLVSTYGYSYGDVVLAKARAHNINGYGGYSSPNTASVSFDDIV